MLIISTFEHSIEVEQALAVLESIGVHREKIMTVIMDNHDERIDKNATNHPNKTTLAFEVGMACSTALSVIGISAGFVLEWGPIIWGILSAAFGFLIGYVGTRILQKKYFRQVLRMKERLPELAVLIDCQESHFHDVQRILWEYRALSVGTIKQ
ncbi:hypothetical protein [Paenibacillus sp. OV219]|uniref:hypothetical protein n=1 Tax=Paenibacillus sp. OV219 TaxID=1884377 RepID=UPI0008C5476F|nr:hypothetical protein [Paenibacillus sp. OV219]SEO96499.1 hypothetical protein SAMN05518847_113122 [Paenibacillus sp. OV219]